MLGTQAVGDNANSGQIRFGVFELDPRTRELRRNGVLVKLQDQPFQVLLALIEKPGELVTREELEKRIWHGDTFVDFEVGLSRAVNKLREALGDTAENPRFVQTLPKRGYRFIAPVDGGALTPETPAPVEKPRTRLPMWGWAAGAVIALLVVAGVVWLVVRGGPGGEQLVVRPLTAEPGLEFDPSFSPDGSKITYAWTRTDGKYADIYVRSLTSGDSLQITKTPDIQEVSPVWSPDGNWIAFIGRRDGPKWLLVVPALGGVERRIATVRNFEYDIHRNWLTWTPDGQTLLFPDRQDGGNSIAVYAVSVSGGDKWRVTDPPPGGVDSSPSVSADGTTLAFVRSATSLFTGSRLFTASLSPAVRLVGQPSPVRQDENNVVEQVDWIGHEKRLTYLYPVGSRGTGGVYSLRVDGRDRPRLIFPISALNFAYTRMSPDGRRLAYSSTPPSSGFGRFELPPDPTREVSLRRVPASTAVNSNPNCSADGRSFAYGSNRSGLPEIWTSLADGSQPNRITSMDGPETGTPRWSPDGKRIAFDSAPNFNADIFIVNSDGGAPTRLTTEPSAEFNPSWSWDGKWIYFTSNRTGAHEMWKAPSAGGPAVQITRRGGFGGFESPDGKYVYYGTTYWNPELRRVPVDGGNEETLVLRFRYIHDLKVSRTGVYFLPVCRSCQTLDQAWELNRYRFSDGKVEIVARFRAMIHMGLAVPLDDSYILVNTKAMVNTNIMIVEGFR